MINKSSLYLLVVIISTFFMFLQPTADSDLGWHLRYGDYVLSHQQLMHTNQFSWTMTDYDWPNHSWAYDILTAGLFHAGGFTLLSIAGSLLITLSLTLALINQKPTHTLMSFGVFSFFGAKLLNIGLRSQLISLLFIITFWQLVQKLKSTASKSLPPHIAFALVVLFLLWANFHGQFVLGLGLLWLYLLGALFDKTASLKLFLLTLGASAITLINPWGLKLIHTVVAHLNHPLTQNIFEWMPWELTNLPMLIYLLYLTWFWYRYNRASKRSLALALPLLALTLLSLKSRRLIPFFILLSVNQLPLVLSKLPQRIRNWLPLAYGLVMLTSFLTFKPQTILHQTWASYCQTQVLCSENVVSFLTNAHFTGRILNAYRLGGHLIYRYPQAQVFIDGRMTLWADNSGVYPFQTYLDIVHTTPVGKQALQTLAPDLVIVHPQFELAPYLETLGWPKVFSDDTVNVYQNPLSQKLLVQ